MSHTEQPRMDAAEPLHIARLHFERQTLNQIPCLKVNSGCFKQGYWLIFF